MELIGGIFAVGPCVWIPERKILVLSDLHLGFEDYLIKHGVLVPRSHLKDLFFLLNKILSIVSPEIIIFNGDIKHDFGGISGQEWSDVSKIIDFLRGHCDKLVFVRGNHDAVLMPIVARKGLTVVKEFVAGETLVIHGDSAPSSVPRVIKNIIVGHAHPAIRLRNSVRAEIFKCFLVGKWRRKNLVVLPSINPLIEGSDVLRDRNISPFLSKSAIGSFNVFIVDGVAVLKFGKVAELV